MYLFLKAVILTGVAALAPWIARDKRPHFSVYLVLFWLMWGMLILFSDLAAREHPIYQVPRLKDIVQQLDYKAYLTPDQVEFVHNEIKHHKWHGDFYLKKAQDRCWYLPKTSDREKARHCFEAALASSVPGTPMTRIIAGLLILFTEYSLDCIDEMYAIEDDIRQANYHYEMLEFFENVLVLDNKDNKDKEKNDR